MALSHTWDDVDFDDTAFRIVDEYSVEVSFHVTVAPPRAVACAVEALDEEFGTVGWKVVEYPPSASVGTHYTVTVPTVALATTGIANDCWALP